jgi:hypothetical protein
VHRDKEFDAMLSTQGVEEVCTLLRWQTLHALCTQHVLVGRGQNDRCVKL